MNEIVWPIISAIVSWIVTYFTIKYTLKSEKLKLQYDYEKLLIGQRLTYYPELFKITQDIGKQNKSASDNISCIEGAYKHLKIRRETGWFILLWEKSLTHFNDLKESLKANPGNGKGWYTQEQLEKIWKQRNKLRWALKDDIWINIDNYID